MKVYLVPKIHEWNEEAIAVSTADEKLALYLFRRTSDNPTQEDDAEFVALLKNNPHTRALLAYRDTVVIRGNSIGIETEENWRFANACMLDLSAGYGSGERSAHAMWRFDLNDLGMVPRNSFAETFNEKSVNWVANRRSPRHAVLYLPFTSSSPTSEEATLQIFTGNPSLVTVLSGEPTEIVTLDDIHRMRDKEGLFLPGLTLTRSSVHETDGIVFDVEISWGGKIPETETAFVSTTAGYISKQRVTLTNGKGRFKWMPIGLDSGDQATVQAGFRLFSGIASEEVKAE